MRRLEDLFLMRTCYVVLRRFSSSHLLLGSFEHFRRKTKQRIEGPAVVVFRKCSANRKSVEGLVSETQTAVPLSTRDVEHVGTELLSSRHVEVRETQLLSSLR